MVKNEPIELTKKQIASITLDPAFRVRVGGIWGWIEGGKNYRTHMGKVLVLEASNLQVFFLVTEGTKKNRIYAQPTTGFIGDIRSYPATKAGLKALGMAKLAVLEVNLILGVVSAVSGVGFVVVLGTDILQFMINNKQNFPKWRGAISAVLRVRKRMKQLAPTLYDRVFDAALLAAWRGVYATLGIAGKELPGNIPDSAANDPKIVGRGLGAIVGKVGKNMLAQRLTVLSVIITLLLQIIMGALKAVPGAVKISVDKRKITAKEIIDSLKKVGVSIRNRDVQAILDEIEKNADGVKALLLDLQKAFKVFQTDNSKEKSHTGV